jgi:hypothetical protein
MFDETKGDLTLTLAEAKSYYNDLYAFVNDITKVKLKCWLNYCEGRSEGSKVSMTFTNYINRMKLSDYLQLVRTFVVDCSDIGEVEKVSKLILDWSSVGKEKLQST